MRLRRAAGLGDQIKAGFNRSETEGIRLVLNAVDPAADLSTRTRTMKHGWTSVFLRQPRTPTGGILEY